MNKWITIFAAALMCAGCFDNKGKPEDVPTVIGLKALASTNRTGVVRVILRGDKGAITADMLSGLDSVKMIDLSERGTSAVQPEVLKLKGIKEFYFASNGMVSIPDLSGWAATLDYLNLDNNSIKEIPESLAKLTGLKWLRLNGNQIKEVPGSLSALKNLRRIYLKKNGLASVPEVVKEWTSLEDISLDGNPVSVIPDWLVAMPKLRAVSLNDTRVSKLPADLSAWRDLDMLSLGSCPISREEMQRIRKALPDVAIVF
jgi:Leucine-rich repeat (LRR) protein